jgi:hypothetical protein
VFDAVATNKYDNPNGACGNQNSGLETSNETCAMNAKESAALKAAEAAERAAAERKRLAHEAETLARRERAAADEAWGRAVNRLYKAQEPLRRDEAEKAAVYWNSAEGKARKERESREYQFRNREIKDLPAGVVARFRARHPGALFGLEDPPSELRADAKGALTLMRVKDRARFPSKNVPRRCEDFVSTLSNELDRVEWMLPALEEQLRPYLRERIVRPDNMFTTPVDPLARRRRLSELHPDRLGRDQTAAERREYTKLASTPD